MMKFVLLFTALFVPVSCGIADLEHCGDAASNPSAYNQILGAGEEIFIEFGFEPDKVSSESLFSVLDFKSSIEGRLRWEGRKLIFSPVSDLAVSERYVLKYRGIVKSRNSEKSHDFNICIPFFYAASPSYLRIVDFFPGSGSTIEGEDEVSVLFSCGIDTGSFSEGFSLSPRTAYSVVWEEGNKKAVIKPEKPWEDLEIYRFVFSEKLKSENGVPLAGKYEYLLYSDNGGGPPEVLSFDTALNDGLYYPVILSGLSSVKYKDAVRISFSEEMDKSSSEEALSVKPYIPGRKYWADASSLVFIPERGWECGTEYEVSVSALAEGARSSRMKEKASERFVPDIEYMGIEKVEGGPDDGFPIFDFDETVPVDIDVGSEGLVDNDYNFGFVFTSSFDTDAEKESVCSNIGVEALFPASCRNPYALSFKWITDSFLVVRYGGFVPSDSSSERFYYYILKVKGSENGIINSRGSFMKDDVKILLRTKG